MVSSTNNQAPALVGTSGDTLREAFGRALTEIAHERSDFVVFDADVAGGTGVHHFRKAHPQRFFQFGIAEQNMISAAGGFAAVSGPVVVTTFAVFMLRGFEQARLSVAYCNRNVKLVASHPGLDVGPDGASAQCIEDLAAFSSLPGMTVISPCDPVEAALATRAMLDHDGPVYMRTGRSPCPRVLADDASFRIGKGSILREGSDVSIIACGVEVGRALRAAELLAAKGISARVVNMATIKPIDEELVVRCARETRCILTAEDHSTTGGLGAAVAECVARLAPVLMDRVGLREQIGRSGDPEELAARYGIDAPGIAATAERLVARARGESS